MKDKIETLAQVEADLDANVAAIGGAVERLHALYQEKIEKLEGEIEDALIERDAALARHEDLTDSLLDLLPGKFNISDNAAVVAHVEDVFQMFDDVREVVKTLEPLLGGFSDEDSMETVGLRALVRRLADRLG